MIIRKFMVSVVLLCLVSATRAQAQQRPLVTEDPESIGTGRVLIEGGFEMAWDQFFPLSGIHGNVLRGPSLGVSVGISPIAEVQVDWGLFQRVTVTDVQGAPLSNALELTNGRGTSLEDLTVATKIRMAGETGATPALGVRFGTKLPTAKRTKGIGQGTTDFFAGILIGKTVRSVRTVGNVALLMLGNPVRADVPLRSLALGVSVARAVTNAFEVVGEINGHLDPWGKSQPIGTESRGAFRLGARYTYSLLRLDGGAIVGMTPRDPSFALTFGATYVIAP